MTQRKRPTPFLFLAILFACFSANTKGLTNEPEENSSNFDVTADALNSSINSDIKTGIYNQKNGTDILIDKAANLVVNIPIIQHSSYREFSGYYYEPFDTTYPGGFYGDNVASSQIANLN